MRQGNGRLKATDVARTVRDARNRGAFPIVLAGNCLMQVGVVAGLSLSGAALTAWLTDLTMVQQLTVWAGVSALVSVLLYRRAKGLWTSLVFLGDGVYLEWPSL